MACPSLWRVDYTAGRERGEEQPVSLASRVVRPEKRRYALCPIAAAVAHRLLHRHAINTQAIC